MAEGTRNIQTLTGLSSTNGFPFWFPDVLNNPFNLGIGVVVNSTAAAPSWNIEAAFGFTGTSVWLSSNDTWFQLSGLAKLFFGSVSIGMHAGILGYSLPQSLIIFPGNTNMMIT